MTIDRVTYQKIFPTGMMYLNHKIGVEIQVGEGESPDEAFALAKKTVEQWNLESNPGMAAAMEYMGNGFPTPTNGTIPTQPIEPKDKRVQVMINDLNTVTDLKVLETYEFLTKNYPEIKEAYQKKLKELQSL